VAAATAVPVEEYLHTCYEPDMEYVNGQLVERNGGGYFHGLLQGLLAGELLNRKAGVFAFLQQSGFASMRSRDIEFPIFA
jgi:hypothetical protein